MPSDEGNILTFLRIRPSKSPSGYFHHDEAIANGDVLLFNLPDSFRSDYVNNSKLKFHYQFNGIIPMNASQDDVFKKVGQAAVQNALDGFNSTIFAYGQTGSGKTFTLTGGPERYADRGIIPRSISMLWNEFRTRTDVQFKAYISYLELYNEQGYDLLDPSHETKSLEDLPKVQMLEDEHGNFHLKNLSMHPADSEEDALNLLFMGDTNRAIAETPMNMASSRSHCIFTLSLECRVVGSDTVRRSKLHLVDLAGSERVGKTNSSGSTLKEAKYINSSLFYLEMVIVALHEKATKGRQHIPYRNSVMTSVLRDSLGGNCKTIMIATINPEAAHTDESLSTCRFAQRVSLIKNKATINEDVDPAVAIQRLKTNVMSLREEVAFLKGEAGEGDSLTPIALEEVKTACRTYCDDMDPQSVLNLGKMTLTKIRAAFSALKELVIDSRSKGGGGGRLIMDGSGGGSNSGEVTEEAKALMVQVQDLKSCLLQRENEIAILVNMVKKGKTPEDVEMASRASSRATARGSSDYRDDEDARDGRSVLSLGGSSATSARERERARGEIAAKHQSQHQQLQEREREREREREERLVKRHLFGVAPPVDRAIFDDAAKSFEWFQERCSLNAAIEENRELLRDKITEAKMVGERANQSRGTITYLKSSIEAIRRERALHRLDVADSKDGDGSNDGADTESPEEQTHRRAIEQEKVVYKDSFERLRVLKPEIEHVKKVSSIFFILSLAHFLSHNSSCPPPPPHHLLARFWKSAAPTCSRSSTSGTAISTQGGSTPSPIRLRRKGGTTLTL